MQKRHVGTGGGEERSLSQTLEFEVRSERVPHPPGLRAGSTALETVLLAYPALTRGLICGAPPALAAAKAQLIAGEVCRKRLRYLAGM